MKKGNGKLLLLVALLIIVGAAIVLLPTEEGAAQSSETAQSQEAEDNEKEAAIAESNIIGEGDQAPEFSIEMTDGQTITLESLRGKVVLLNFWATWCPPCREELKRVQADLIDRFEGRDFVFLPVSRGEEKSTVLEFLQTNNYTFVAGLDSDQAVYNKYAKNYIPRNYLINRHGVVVQATIGYEAEEFDALLQTIEMTLNAR